MIEKSNSKRPAYWVGSEVFGSLAEAQRAEVTTLLCGDKSPTDTESKVIDFVIENAEKIVAVLKPKRVKVADTTPRKKRTAKGNAAPAAPTA